jgi:predicted CXXCH cytochrome family protein
LSRGLFATVLCAGTTLALGLPPSGVGAQDTGTSPDQGCLLCHGELEFLRRQAGSLEQARTLLVPHGALPASAHDGMACTTCHEGFDPFPHPAAVTTESCASCHEMMSEVWASSVHAGEDEAECSACHGVHDVLPADSLRTPSGVARMSFACTTCHETSALPLSDPHAVEVSCASCHTAHATRVADGPGSAVAPLAQVETCGACHIEEADSARTDVHYEALVADGRASLALLRGGQGPRPPTCTSCHGAHGMLAPSHARFDQDMVDQCAVCHEDYADAYFGTYHGKATAVGSEIVATCDHCHGSHRIFPAADDRSWVAMGHLVETCGRCHEHASASFVEYDSHPNPLDRDRNAPLFFSFVFMNVLLFGVLVVFGLHTGLWWVRLILDDRRRISGSPGGGHG